MSITITISFSITVTSADGTIPEIHIEAPIGAVEESGEITLTPSSDRDSKAHSGPDPDYSESPQSEEEEPGELQATGQQSQTKSVQANPASRFLWTSGMIATLERDFQAESQATPRRAVKSILDDIAGKHGWPPSAVGYKFYSLKSSKQQGWTEIPDKQPAKAQAEQPQEQNQRKKRATKKKSELPTALIESENPPFPLAPGDAPWEVRADGMPLKLSLAYTHGKFPYPANTRVSYRDQVYRVGRSWSNGFELTSEDADEYETQ